MAKKRAAKKKGKPWERQAWDTPGSFAAFHDYYLPQMPPRSAIKAFNKNRREKGAKKVVKKLPGNWQRWAQGQNSKGKKIRGSFKWKDRAKAWDDHLASQDLDEWEEKRKQVRRLDWSAGEELRALYDQIMAASPDFVIQKRKFLKGKDGAPDQIIITLALDGHLMTKVLETGSKLQRQAAEMSTVDGKDKFVFPFIELVDAIDEAERRIANSKNGKNKPKEKE